jgi:hypothetical protein
MTTKIELQEKAIQGLEKREKRLEEAKLEHSKFEGEDKQTEDYWRLHEKLREKQEALLSKKWVGNWENRNNWYHGLMPSRFYKLAEQYPDEVNLLRQVLTDLSIENEKTIVETPDYLEIENQISDLVFPAKSKKHLALEEEIQDLKNAVEWYDRRIRDLENRGKFIEICKNEKKNLEAELRRKREAELKDLFKKIITGGEIK